MKTIRLFPICCLLLTASSALAQQNDPTEENISPSGEIHQIVMKADPEWTRRGTCKTREEEEGFTHLFWTSAASFVPIKAQFQLQKGKPYLGLFKITAPVETNGGIIYTTDGQQVIHAAADTDDYYFEIKLTGEMHADDPVFSGSLRFDVKANGEAVCGYRFDNIRFSIRPSIDPRAEMSELYNEYKKIRAQMKQALPDKFMFHLIPALSGSSKEIDQIEDDLYGEKRFRGVFAGSMTLFQGLVDEMFGSVEMKFSEDGETHIGVIKLQHDDDGRCIQVIRAAGYEFNAKEECFFVRLTLEKECRDETSARPGSKATLYNSSFLEVWKRLPDGSWGNPHMTDLVGQFVKDASAGQGSDWNESSFTGSGGKSGTGPSPSSVIETSPSEENSNVAVTAVSVISEPPMRDEELFGIALSEDNPADSFNLIGNLRGKMEQEMPHSPTRSLSFFLSPVLRSADTQIFDDLVFTGENNTLDIAGEMNFMDGAFSGVTGTVELTKPTHGGETPRGITSVECDRGNCVRTIEFVVKGAGDPAPYYSHFILKADLSDEPKVALNPDSILELWTPQGDKWIKQTAELFGDLIFTSPVAENTDVTATDKTVPQTDVQSEEVSADEPPTADLGKNATEGNTVTEPVNSDPAPATAVNTEPVVSSPTPTPTPTPVTQTLTEIQTQAGNTSGTAATVKKTAAAVSNSNGTADETQVAAGEPSGTKNAKNEKSGGCSATGDGGLWMLLTVVPAWLGRKRAFLSQTV